MIHTFIELVRISSNVARVKIENCFSLGVVNFLQTVDLGGFKTQPAGFFFLPCHFLFHALNTMCSSFFRMHMEEVNKLIQFLFIVKTLT